MTVGFKGNLLPFNKGRLFKMSIGNSFEVCRCFVEKYFQLVALANSLVGLHPPKFHCNEG